MPTIKIHGATLDQAAISEFYPVNTTYPNFEYFYFQYDVDNAGNYYLKVYAIEQNGDVIKEVTVLKEVPATPFNYNSLFIPANVCISVQEQLSKLSIPIDEVIKELKLSPKKCKQAFAGFDVKIKISNLFIVIDKEINPSPPATRIENDWAIQP